MNLIPPHVLRKTTWPPGAFLRGIGWQGYEKILEVIGNRRVCATYLRGNLELMSPLPLHEAWKKAFSRLFDYLALEVGVHMRGVGSATFRREDRDRGLEPDECYYLANYSRLRHWPEIDLTRDPPPDLAIEIDITTRWINRMEVYAGLGVPEVWCFDGEALQVHLLNQEGRYVPAARSLAMPFFPVDEVVAALEPILADQSQDDGEVLRRIRAWVRTRVLPLKQAAEGSSPSPRP